MITNQNQGENLLPSDGVVFYFGKVIDKAEANMLFETLLTTIQWQNDEAFIFGKHFITKRKVAWYAGSEIPYTYSNATKHALPWTQELLHLKELTEKLTGDQFNSCLLNLYHNGAEGMAWHSDDEKALKKHAAIASLSFGAVRKFCFKHKSTGEKICIELENGSLLVMRGDTQQFWQHRLPPTTKIKDGRINLTFRSMIK